MIGDPGVRLGSIIDLSLVDVPGIPVTVIFTAGCNFDCAYCQNAELIPIQSGVEMSVQEIVQRSLGNLTDGFCITGGEPTIHKDLPDLAQQLKTTHGGHVNLNTQGSVPEVLEKTLQHIDSVWFDIKAAPERYPEIIRKKSNPWHQVRRSIELLIDSTVEFWPRITYASRLMTANDVVQIADALNEMGYQGKLLVQNYIKSAGVRDETSTCCSEPDKSELGSIPDLLPKGVHLALEWR